MGPKNIEILDYRRHAIYKSSHPHTNFLNKATTHLQESMEDTLLYLFLFILFFLALKIFQSRIRRQNLPPSPPAIPIIGHLNLLKPPMHRTFHSLAEKYGPIIFLRFSCRPVVIVSSSSAAEECFTKNDIVFANRPKLLTGKHIAYNYTTLVHAPYGDHWRNLRRIGSIEIFSTHRLNVLQSIRKDEIRRLLTKLSYQSLRDFAKVELKSVFNELTFNIMMRMIAGKRYYGDDVSNEKEARKFREMMKEVITYSGVSNPGDFMPILNWISERKVIMLAKKVDKFLQGLIDEHRNNKENLERKHTMIDHLLALQESQPDYYTDEIIKGLIQVTSLSPSMILTLIYLIFSSLFFGCGQV